MCLSNVNGKSLITVFSAYSLRKKQVVRCARARASERVLQEYIAGADTVMEDPTTRDFVVMRARMMAAR